MSNYYISFLIPLGEEKCYFRSGLLRLKKLTGHIFYFATVNSSRMKWRIFVHVRWHRSHFLANPYFLQTCLFRKLARYCKLIKAKGAKISILSGRKRQRVISRSGKGPLLPITNPRCVSTERFTLIIVLPYSIFLPHTSTSSNVRLFVIP